MLALIWWPIFKISSTRTKQNDLKADSDHRRDQRIVGRFMQFLVYKVASNNSEKSKEF